MRLCIALVCMMLSGSAFAQSSETPISVSVCQLQSDPAAFNKKLVKVQGMITMGFEDFGIHDSNCTGFKTNSIWLMYGGDVSDNVTFCCGEHEKSSGKNVKVEGIAVPIKKDGNLIQLNSLLKAYRRAAHLSSDENRDADYPGRYYDVTATVVGRFFSGTKQTWPGGAFYMGYGHMGCCMLLTIQEVSSIDTVKTNGKPGDLECHQDFWRTSNDHSIGSVQIQGTAVEPLQVAERALNERQFEWKDSSPGAFKGACKTKDLEQDTWATCNWISTDGLDEYVVQLRRPRMLKKALASHDKKSWSPEWVRRNSCVQE